jgi:hypothetical protein
MSDITNPSQETDMRAIRLFWTPKPSGEHNSTFTHYKGYRLEVYSNRNKTRWDYRIDDEDHVGPYDTMEEAQQAAVNDASEQSSW